MSSIRRIGGVRRPIELADALGRRAAWSVLQQAELAVGRLRDLGDAEELRTDIAPRLLTMLWLARRMNATIAARGNGARQNSALATRACPRSS